MNDMTVDTRSKETSCTVARNMVKRLAVAAIILHWKPPALRRPRAGESEEAARARAAGGVFASGLARRPALHFCTARPGDASEGLESAGVGSFAYSFVAAV